MSSLRPNELVDSMDDNMLLSNTLLSQMEGVHVDMYTINFARRAVRDIHIGLQGQRLYNHCLLNLPEHRSNEPRLQFGWGSHHLLKNSGVQLYEYEHLLLASALCEYFSEDYAAAIFNELGNAYEDSERPKPHFSSFLNFVHVANGVLAISDFAVNVDDRIRLNPYRLSSDGIPFAKQPQETISVSNVARALQLLYRTNQGGSNELILVGGDVLGWFSAFADICLGIDVTLMDNNGKELHRANNNGGWHLKLKFVPWDNAPGTESPEVFLNEKTSYKPSSSLVKDIHSGRITQDSLFKKVFGVAFSHLDQTETKTFANALGGLARKWELQATQEGISADVISPDNRSNPGSWGRGLIQTWSNWFPELRHLQGRMERALKLDLEAVYKQCEDSANYIESLCKCYLCSAIEGPAESPTNLPRDGFCLATLMETIVMLGLALSRVALTPNMYPSRAGVLGMYKSQVRKRVDLKKADLDYRGRHILLFGEDWNSTFPKRLANAVALFSGSWPPSREMPENMLGISHEGICAYSMMLERGNKGAKHMDDQVIRILTGSINWRQKTLKRVCLGPVEDVDPAMKWDVIQCDHFREKLYVN